MQSTVYLSTAYFPPIQYISKLMLFPEACIEEHESFTKKTFRNRCEIYSSNGKLDLSIPLTKNSRQKSGITRVEIDNESPWQDMHYKSIESAYRNSPFFEFYIDDLMVFFQKKYTYLWELNKDILSTLLPLFDIECEIINSEEFILPGELENDFRFNIHPKKQNQVPDPYFSPGKYVQVFDDKHGFIPNLSCLDLLFSLGPESYLYLKDCISTKKK